MAAGSPLVPQRLSEQSSNDGTLRIEQLRGSPAVTARPVFHWEAAGCYLAVHLTDLPVINHLAGTQSSRATPRRPPSPGCFASFFIGSLLRKTHLHPEYTRRAAIIFSFFA